MDIRYYTVRILGLICVIDLLVFVITIIFMYTAKQYNIGCQCTLPDSLAKEIDSYEPIVKKILDIGLKGSFKGSTWKELEIFVNQFGSRLYGSQALEDSIDYVLNRSKILNLDNVHGETAMIPHWVRGKESATLLKPIVKDLAMLGLGGSIGTPPEGIIAKAIVVKSFSELQKRASEIPGCIVVYNQKFISYNQSKEYKEYDATEASKLGAVAVLIRSPTPYTSNTPHTGLTRYDKKVRKIPTACISVEAFDLLNRVANQGDELIINIKMEAQNFPDAESCNAIAEIQGSSKPNKVVVVSGHIDSWDVGQGVVDDAGGAFVAWNALVLLRKLGLQPKRTIRSIMCTNEEFGKNGALQYIKEHKSEISNLQLVMESVKGTFTPLGLEVTGTDLVKCTLQRVVRLLTPLGKMDICSPDQGSDIKKWIKLGVPGATLWNNNEYYFVYHHTNVDTIEAEDPKDLDKGTALFAAVSYIIADISIDLPHHPQI